MLVATLVLFLGSCSDDEKTQIILESNALEIGNEASDTQTLKFTATENWEISSSAPWILINPKSGLAGEQQIKISLQQEQTQLDSREGVITITSNGVTKEIKVSQKEKLGFLLGEKEFDVSDEGGTIEINYVTNIDPNKIETRVPNPEWCHFDEVDTRAAKSYSKKIVIDPNEDFKKRDAAIYFTYLGKTINIVIRQAARRVGVSTDYSQDGKVKQVYQASVGNGIQVVLLGDGFIDKDIESGYYDRVMRKGAEHLFDEEPFKSHKEYFDVYYVNAVSKNNVFSPGYETKFGCSFGRGTEIKSADEHNTCIEYALKVPGLNLDEALIVTILNSRKYSGTCYFGFSRGNKVLNLAVGYCPVINGINHPDFGKVLNHECVGHGFAKLNDEYAYREQGAIPRDEIDYNRYIQTLGWSANVDFVSNPNKTLWGKFYKDKRYDKENLGAYEGACTYWTGAYRPTINSIMNANEGGFNAPSREAIYKRIHSLADRNYVYNLEEFIDYDEVNRIRIATRGYVEPIIPADFVPFAPPVMVNKDISNY